MIVVVVVAGKEVNIPVIVKIRKNGSLNKDIAIGQLNRGVGLPAISRFQEQGSTGRRADENVIKPVAVDISSTYRPDRSTGKIAEVDR